MHTCCLAHSHMRCRRRKAASAVSTLWALHNCIGPYLLVHYTWIGRGGSLKRASTAGMLASAAIVVLAAAAAYLFTPAQYDYKEVRRRLDTHCCRPQEPDCAAKSARTVAARGCKFLSTRRLWSASVPPGAGAGLPLLRSPALWPIAAHKPNSLAERLGPAGQGTEWEVSGRRMVRCRR